MRIVRYWDSAAGAPRYGVVKEEAVYQLDGGPFRDELKITKNVVPLQGLKLLAPTEPTKIVCGGLNYKGHAEETGQPIPEVPVCFLKATSALIGHEQPIVYPPQTTRLDYELELAVVVKKTMRYTPPEEVPSHILGYACGNDVTDRDMCHAAKHNLVISKSFDTFCPAGPWIETELDPSAIELELRVNGQIRQKVNTSTMIFPVPVMLSYMSNIMTLNPGDLILTGTPSGIERMNVGDVCEITIEGIGTLRNPIVASPASARAAIAASKTAAVGVA